MLTHTFVAPLSFKALFTVVETFIFIISSFVLLESLDFTFCNGKYKIIIPKTSKEENKTEKGIKQKDKKTKKKKNKKKKVGNQKETEVKIILSDLLANSNLCKLIDNNPFEEQIFVKPSEVI